MTPQAATRAIQSETPAGGSDWRALSRRLAATTTAIATGSHRPAALPASHVGSPTATTASALRGPDPRGGVQVDPRHRREGDEAGRVPEERQELGHSERHVG